jgi:hypothetical protein
MKKLLLSAVVLIIAGTLYSGTRFTDNGNGTISDTATGLIWTKCSLNTVGAVPATDTTTNCTNYGNGMWPDALQACENLDFAGRTNWRLPNINELKSIIDYKTSSPPFIDKSYFPGATSAGYWSSTTFAFNSVNAWIVIFGTALTQYSGKSNYFLVRCVATQ